MNWTLAGSFLATLSSFCFIVAYIQSPPKPELPDEVKTVSVIIDPARSKFDKPRIIRTREYSKGRIETEYWDAYVNEAGNVDIRLWNTAIGYRSED